jgi:hypothetical protein
VRQTSSPVERLLPELTEWVRETTDSVVEQSRKLDPAPELILASGTLRNLFLRGEPGRIAGLSLILHDFSAPLFAISAPTLIIWGQDDMVAPPRTGVMLAERIRHAELVTLPWVGHCPMEQAPEEVLGLVERHLDSATVAAPPASLAGKSQGDARCRGQSDMRFRGVYDRIVLERCDHAQLDAVHARQLVVRQSSASLSRSSVDRGIVAEGSDVVMTGGRVGGDIALDLDGSRLDLAGVTIEGTQQPYRLRGASRLVLSVCSTSTPGGLVHAHGVKISVPPTPRAEASPPRPAGDQK